MEIEGKIIEILGEQSGEGRNGTWRKNRFVLETKGQYPKKVCIDVWGDRFDQMPIQENAMVKAQIDVESREWKGNWYTDVKAWKVETLTGGTQSNESTSSPPFDTSGVPAGPEPDRAEDDFDDELPF